MKHYRNRLPRMIFVLATAVTLGLGTAACGGDSGDSDSTVAGAQSSDAQPDSAEDANAALVAYSQCMRENGVPSFPDPENGRLQIRGRQGSDMDPESSSFQAAQQACKDKEPPGIQQGGGPDGQAQENLLAYVSCMRENGVPNFPDPQPDGRLLLNPNEGVDPESPQFLAADEKCQQEGGPGGPQAPGGA
ncbi:hypothetical protein LWF15_20300 [Kineosporia rhizophila]|uniref:hypothetical protein n=1 Tax=Kineosporia rhizophila TaxID=84633 RepID=UPI001E57018B|nr:hypothetical protein [Kineosporia rhizophila]MCE0537839.1 hypothetical protein [Kineosporia rhizophila]